MIVFSPILLPLPFIIILTSINATKKKGGGGRGQATVLLTVKL